MGTHYQHDLVTIGVDPHKHSWTAIGLEERAHALATPLRVAATPAGFGDLQQWARPWPRRRWAVENASGLGRDLTQRLLDAGEQVLDVAAKLSTRVRLLAGGTPRKTDPADAHAVAAGTRSPIMSPDPGPSTEIRLDARAQRSRPADQASHGDAHGMTHAAPSCPILQHPSPASSSFVLAALRALQLDPRLGLPRPANNEGAAHLTRIPR